MTNDNLQAAREYLRLHPDPTPHLYLTRALVEIAALKAKVKELEEKVEASELGYRGVS